MDPLIISHNKVTPSKMLQDLLDILERNLLAIVFASVLGGGALMLLAFLVFPHSIEFVQGLTGCIGKSCFIPFLGFAFSLCMGWVLAITIFQGFKKR